MLRRKLGTEAALTTFTAIQNDLVGGFLDRHVKDAPSDFPARELATHPEVVVQDLSWLRQRAQTELHEKLFVPARSRTLQLTKDGHCVCARTAHSYQNRLQLNLGVRQRSGSYTGLASISVASCHGAIRCSLDFSNSRFGTLSPPVFGHSMVRVQDS